MGSDLLPEVQDTAKHEILNQYLSAAKARQCWDGNRSTL